MNNNLQENQNIIVYEDGEIELKVSVAQESIWLTQKQIAELFEVTKQNISLHTIEIFKTQELHKNSTLKKYLTVQKNSVKEGVFYDGQIFDAYVQDKKVLNG